MKARSRLYWDAEGVEGKWGGGVPFSAD